LASINAANLAVVSRLRCSNGSADIALIPDSEDINESITSRFRIHQSARDFCETYVQRVDGLLKHIVPHKDFMGSAKLGQNVIDAAIVPRTISGIRHDGEPKRDRTEGFRQLSEGGASERFRINNRDGQMRDSLLYATPRVR
jgi:hypothetical protein